MTIVDGHQNPHRVHRARVRRGQRRGRTLMPTGMWALLVTLSPHSSGVDVSTRRVCMSPCVYLGLVPGIRGTMFE